ncbi:hypothetical protein KSF78_0007095 [Schistosoma japonicum]|nr:hypothetical protein KSF78_0007095 [Schistosoma japonicum]
MIQILDGPDGEQNFETARARAWQSRHKSDYDFHRLAAELTSTSQFEITLEMIHMVSYVKKELKHKRVTKVSQNATKEKLEPGEHIANRSLPGFQTILQCGKTFDCDTLLNKVDSLTFNSPLDADEKVNRIFDKSQSILGKTKASLVDDPRLTECNLLLRIVSCEVKVMINLKITCGDIPLVYFTSMNQINTHYSIIEYADVYCKAHGLCLIKGGLETTNWGDNQQVVYSNKKSLNSSNSFHASNIKHSQVEAKEIPLDDMNAKMNVCMDDTLLLEFLDKNLAGANSEMDTDFAGQCGLNSPTAFVEDMLKKAQKSLNHHKY